MLGRRKAGRATGKRAMVQQRARAGRGVAWLAAIWALLVAACAPAAKPAASNADVAAPADAARATDAAGAPACPPGTAMADGKCCPNGQFFDAAAQACVAAGPAACQGNLATAPDQCLPRWCWDWHDGSGAKCNPSAADCLPAGRRCTAAEAAQGLGCPAGSYPSGGGACVQAGIGAVPLPAAPTLPVLADAAMPADTVPVDTLPAGLQSRFCAGVGGARLCQGGGTDCPPGQMADPDYTKQCRPFAPANLCPDGFAPDPNDMGTALGALQGCLPAEPCDGDKYAPDVAGPDTLYVDAAAPAGGDGSLAKPLATLNAAVAIAKPKATIAVAKGTYAESLLLLHPVSIVGKCIGGTRIDPGKSSAVVVAVTGGDAEGAVGLEHLTLGGTAVGLKVDGGPVVLGSYLHFDATISRGVRVDGKAAGVHLKRAYVNNTQAASNGDGIGLFVANGGTLWVQDVRVRHSVGGGVVAVTGGGLYGHDLTIDGTAPRTTDGTAGYGLFVGAGSFAQLVSVRSHGNSLVGVNVAGKVAYATIDGLLADANQPSEKYPDSGAGVSVAAGGEIHLNSARITGNWGSGLVVDQAGSTAHLEGIIVDATQPDSQLLRGDGIEVTNGAHLTLHSARVTNCLLYGILALGSGSQITGSGWTVDHIDPQSSDDASARGVRVKDGAAVQVTGLLVRDITGTGIRVSQNGATATLSQALFTAIAANVATGVDGHGIDILAGGSVRGAGVQVSGCVSAALRVAGTAAKAQLAGALFTDTLYGLTGSYGEGAFVEEGGDCSLSGSRLSNNRWLGVRVLSQNVAAAAALAGTIVDATGSKAQTADDTAAFGYGVAAIGAKASAAVTGSWLTDNQGAGLFINEGSGSATDTRIDRTRSAKSGVGSSGAVQVKVLADGVAAIAAQMLVLQGCAMAGNGRAGIFVDGGGPATIEACVVSGNYFGLATQHGAAVKPAGLALFGNQQNAATDQGLQVPPPPTLVEVEGK